MCPFFFLLIALFVVVMVVVSPPAAAACGAEQSPPPATVPELDIKAYSGFWLQAYANQNVMESIERDVVCSAAYYTLEEDGSIGVHNSGNYDSPDGPPSGVTGKATQPDPAYPGRLVVSFEGFPGGSYWILGLGPVVGGQYEWSIVSGRSQEDLFILARNLDEFETKYADDVLAMVHDMGFNEEQTKPIKSVQEGCQYPPPPSPRMVDQPLLDEE
jgi:lipocalin